MSYIRASIIVSMLVAAAPSSAEVDFDTEIVPLLSKAGCNAAACHGSAAGQAGFRLSLFGGDPEFDYRTIVRELESRRINYRRPEESLLVAKPTGQVDHGGGEVIDSGSDTARTLAQWIQAGAPRLRLRSLEHLSISPSEIVADRVPRDFRITVSASFDDSTERDVTSVAVYESLNKSALEIHNGTIRALRAGRHSAVVRFGGHVRTVSVTSPIGPADAPRVAPLRNNWIDDEINETLTELRLEAAPAASDSHFLRRLYLDLTGRLPAPDTVLAFQADLAGDKRSKAVEHLLGSSEFTDYWTYWLSNQLRLRKPATDGDALEALYTWLKQQIANDCGWNEMASELILSVGDSHEIGTATVHRFFATAREEAEYVSEVFMGVRLRCANCHNHPLDRWTQDDYHGLAAIFAGLDRGRVVAFSGRGEVTHPRTGGAARTRIPGQQFIETVGDARGDLVEWLIDKHNPYFARAMVGRIWEALMGVGLVAPVDDLRATNPASHRELHDRLAAHFVNHDYRLRPVIQLICNSAAYGRSSTPATKAADARFYSHATEKALSAEVLADALSDVTGVATTFDSVSVRRGMLPVDEIKQTVSRAIDLVDRTKATSKLQFLGQCLPDEGCAPTIKNELGIASKLHLMNGELLNEKITSGEGRLAQMLQKHIATDQIVREFYLRALSRVPTENELAEWRDRIEADDPTERTSRCEDFLWALLNCREFTTIQ